MEFKFTNAEGQDVELDLTGGAYLFIDAVDVSWIDSGLLPAADLIELETLQDKLQAPLKELQDFMLSRSTEWTRLREEGKMAA